MPHFNSITHVKQRGAKKSWPRTAVIAANRLPVMVMANPSQKASAKRVGVKVEGNPDTKAAH